MSRVLADASAIFRREWLRYRRERAYWVGQLAFPLAAVAVLGFGLNDVVALPSRVDYVGHLASGLLVLVVGSGAVGGGFSLIEDRESGFLRALRIAPVAGASIVLGKLAARMVVSLLLVGALVAVLALFTPVRLESPAALVGAVVGVTAVFAALGIGLAARLRRLESFRLIAGLVTVPLYLFSGIFYPIETLPAGMRLLAYANPLSYGVDLLRFALLGVAEIPVALDALLLLGLGGAGMAFAVAAFDRSAES